MSPCPTSTPPSLFQLNSRVLEHNTLTLPFPSMSAGGWKV